MIASFRLLVVLSLRSLVSHRIKSLIVGSLMMFGTFLVVLGTAMLDSISSSMEKSIVSSLTGHIQVYDKDAKDKLQVFGGMGFGSEDIGEIPHFEKVEEALLQVDDVAAVVPMAISNATFNGEGEMDAALNALRKAVAAHDEAQMKVLSERVRQIIGLLIDEEKLKEAITEDTAERREHRATLEKGRSDELWASFATEPLPVLDWLDGQVAPLAPEGQQSFLRYLGTDLEQFSKLFDRFEIADGEMVPPGQRGLLVSKKGYEEYMKNPVAVLLDQVNKAVTVDKKTIADDKETLEKVGRMSRQYPRILFALDSEDIAVLQPKLKALFPDETGDMGKLLQRFLSVDDATLPARYDWFYKEIAPRMDLYLFKVGDTITLQSFTKTGYLRSTTVKIWGTFQFKGLEKSDLAGSTSLSDMMTFRDLYGQPNNETAAELAGMKQQVGFKEVARENAEAELFGGDATVETAQKESTFNDVDSGKLERRDVAVATFDPKEQRKGLVLSAAVILKNPALLHPTMQKIDELSKKSDLRIQALDWRTASGIIGQFILVIAGVLYTAIFIIFIVTIVIINNSMVMATMDRVAEIGTMRALGAQRRFVLGMFLFETVVLGLLAGFVGAALGVALISFFHAGGIPAPNDIFTFLFAGPALHPVWSIGNVVFGMILILVVSVLATAYPARIATRIQPVVAMQGKE